MILNLKIFVSRTPSQIYLKLFYQLSCGEKSDFYSNRMPPNVKKSVSVLHVAAMAGRHKIYQLIVERVMKKKPKKKCHVSTSQVKNPRSNNGSTPLHCAAMLGHYKMCSTILKNVCGDKAVGAKGMVANSISFWSLIPTICPITID